MPIEARKRALANLARAAAPVKAPLSVREEVALAVREARRTRAPLCVAVVAPPNDPVTAARPEPGTAGRELADLLGAPSRVIAVRSRGDASTLWFVVRGEHGPQVRAAVTRMWPAGDAAEPGGSQSSVPIGTADFPGEGTTAEDLLVSCRLAMAGPTPAGARPTSPSPQATGPLSSARPARRFERSAAADRAAPGTWRCEVTWAPGSLEGRFVAREAAPRFHRDSERREFAFSPPLRTSRAGPPQPTDEAQEALAALVSELAAGGWEAAGTGLAWYASRFVLTGRTPSRTRPHLSHQTPLERRRP